MKVIQMSVVLITATMIASLPVLGQTGGHSRDSSASWFSINAGGIVIEDVPGPAGVSIGQVIVGTSISEQNRAFFGFWPDTLVDTSRTTVGTTLHDVQHHGSMGRQIAVGSDGRIHLCWKDVVDPGGYNVGIIRYNSWHDDILSHGETGCDISANEYCGLASIGVLEDRAVIAWHEGFAESLRLPHVAVDFLSGACAFLTTQLPEENCSGIVSGDQEDRYLWPILAVDDDGAEVNYHLVSTEETSEPSSIRSLVYYRGSGELDPDFGTCALFVDSVYSGSAIVCQDPNSDKVALVYHKPRAYQTGANPYDNDVVYAESADRGQSWGDGSAIPTSVTSYNDLDWERPGQDLSALYSSAGCLHIVWNTVYYNQEEDSVSTRRTRIYHWDDCLQCKSTLLTAHESPTACDPGQNNSATCKMNISECNVSGQDRLYVTYTRFNAESGDCSDDLYANGELFTQASTAAGNGWGRPVNLTRTKSPGCAAGDCRSEHWSSTAAYSSDSLHILYIGDRDAGGMIYGEGETVLDSVMLLSLECMEPEDYSSLTAEPASFAWILPPEGQRVSGVLQISNSGTAGADNCFYQVKFIDGEGWLTVDGTTFGLRDIEPGCANFETFEVRAQAQCSSQERLRAVIRFTYDNHLRSDSIDVPVVMQLPACIPGDANGDGIVNVSDAVYLIAYVFGGGPPPQPHNDCSGDADCNCMVNISDAVYLISYIFGDGPAPCGCEDWQAVCK